ncbi:MAG: hypothetical protein KGM42_19895, partial [Hyphomicrobiales bacterium]|nr:hypothetical protein [Hyphomicrobiales bacterium]
TVALMMASIASPARAQMQLPGAVAPAAAGTVSAPAAAKAAKPKPKRVAPAAPRIPTDDAVVGHALMLNGKTGLMEFSRQAKELQLLRLKLAGDQIDRPGEPCEIDLTSQPVALKGTGRPMGVNRYDLDLPACPFSVDIWEGAALAIRTNGACEFKAAGCRVDPTGLWGQPASEIGPQRAKEIEGQRRRAEQDMRSQFKTWIATARGDRDLVSRIAREQAAFSSRREELCRTYAREAQHGYCDLVATEARTSALAAHILPPVDADTQAAAPKRR